MSLDLEAEIYSTQLMVREIALLLKGSGATSLTTRQASYLEAVFSSTGQTIGSGGLAINTSGLNDEDLYIISIHGTHTNNALISNGADTLIDSVLEGSQANLGVFKKGQANEFTKFSPEGADVTNFGYTVYAVRS